MQLGKFRIFKCTFMHLFINPYTFIFVIKTPNDFCVWAAADL